MLHCHSSKDLHQLSIAAKVGYLKAVPIGRGGAAVLKVTRDNGSLFKGAPASRSRALVGI